MAMTRETKVGIGVSCTFACLVCLIVGFKLYEEPHEETNGGEAPVAANTAPEQLEVMPSMDPEAVPPSPSTTPAVANNGGGNYHFPPPLPDTAPPSGPEPRAAPAP